MKKLLGSVLCTLLIPVMASSAFAITENCVPYLPSVTYQQFKPDVQIKEADNGKGEATILVPFRNDEKSWWEFWKPAYVYKKAKIPTEDLPKKSIPSNDFYVLFGALGLFLVIGGIHDKYCKRTSTMD